MAPAGTCVVHLVWAPLGPEPLSRFLNSYRRHDAGASHTLLVILNGFQPGDDLNPWRRLLAGVEHEELKLERRVLDLVAYARATEHVEAERYCFVNSYSVVLADNWLRALEGALAAPGVGLVGATGSWGSVRSYNRFMLGFGGPYASIFSDRRATNKAIAAVSAEPPSEQSATERTKHEPVRFARALLEGSYGFSPFPAPHIRTNGFMLTREVLCSLQLSRTRRKGDAYRLESGRRSITAQVEGLELAARVVARDGRAYDVAEWHASRTLWQGRQENLLIADNQTASYEHGSGEIREALSRYAWGRKADPG
jgi:hypothetical protein